MVHDPQPRWSAGPWGLPWPWLVAAIGLVFVVAGQGLTSGGLPRLAVAFFALGLLAIGVGVMWRFRVAGWQLPERAETAAMLFGAGVASAWTALGLGEAFDSGRRLCGAAAIL